MNLKDHKWAVNIYERPAGDILNLRLQMDLNASICSNPWSYYYDLAQRSWIIYLMISFHVSLANVNLHMRFSTTVWNNFTMQHESGWEFHDCWANSRNLWILHIPCFSPILRFSMHSSSLRKPRRIFTMTNVHTTPPWMHVYHHPIHIWD